MKKQTKLNVKRCLSFLLTLAMVASFIAVPQTVHAQEPPVEQAPIETLDADAPLEIRDGVILHAFDWNLSVIIENLQAIKDAGYTAIQTSPVHGCAGGAQWSAVYQPKNMIIGGSASNPSRFGTEEEFKSLCAAAKELDIKIIVDVVPNHIGGSGDAPWSSAYPENFHNVTTGVGYNDRFLLTQPLMIGGLTDLNTHSATVQNAFIKYLKDLIDAGASGFRYDAIKHIELDDDAPSPASIAASATNPRYPNGEFASDYVKNVTGAAKAYFEELGKVNFQYGEVLQGGNPDMDRMAGYSKYIDLTASQYGHHVRTVLEVGDVGRTDKWVDYAAEGLTADQLVPWVESHDTYNNEGESLGFSPKQIRQGWAMIAARKDASPLFFARNVNASGALNSSVRTSQYVNYSRPQWTHPEVVAVNKFHNAMVGMDENIVSLGNNAVLIERGTDATGGGAVLLNTSTSSRVLGSVEVDFLKDGIYVDTLNPSNVFTVSNGRISGTIPGTTAKTSNTDTNNNQGLVVLMGREDDTPTILSAFPNDDDVIAGNSFTGDQLNLRLSALNVTNASYAVNNGEAVPFAHDDVITVGVNANYNEPITITLVGRQTGVGWITREFTYTRVELGVVIPPIEEPTHVTVYLSINRHANYQAWGGYSYGVHCYTFNPELFGGWPGGKMTRMKYNGVDTHWYKIEMPRAAVGGIIFNTRTKEDVQQQSNQPAVNASMLNNEQLYFYGTSSSNYNINGSSDSGNNARANWDTAFAAGNNIGFAASGVFPPGRNGVIFNTSGGTTIANQYVREGALATRPADPTRSGYLFDGYWYTDTACTEVYDFETPVVNTLGDEHIYAKTLYAGWIELEDGKHLVQFNSQGGSFVMAIPNVENDATITAPVPPVRNGFTFEGWFTEAACETEWVFESDIVTAATTLYAKWVPTPYSITYKDGSIDADMPDSVRETYTILDAFNLDAPDAKAGYTFSGWYSDPLFLPSSRLTSVTAGSTGNITLYARFTADIYTIALDTQEGTGATSVQVTYGGKLPLGIVSPVRANYIFQGYFTEEAGAGVAYYNKQAVRVFDDIITSAPVTTLFAHWIVSCETHTPGDWIIDAASTEDATGIQHKECTVCGATTETEMIPIRSIAPNSIEFEFEGDIGRLQGYSAVTLRPADYIKVIPTVYDENCEPIPDARVTWTSSSPANVRVTTGYNGSTKIGDGGVITAVRGTQLARTDTATVTASVDIGGETVTKSILVTVPPSEVEMIWVTTNRYNSVRARNELTIGQAGTLNNLGLLDAYGYYLNQNNGSRYADGGTGTAGRIQWTTEWISSDTSVATVARASGNNGHGSATVTAVGEGVVDITIRVTQTNVTPNIIYSHVVRYYVSNNQELFKTGADGNSKTAGSIGTLSATVYPTTIGYDQNAVITLNMEVPENMRSGYVNLSALGFTRPSTNNAQGPNNSTLSIDPKNGAVTVSVKDTIEPGTKIIPITVTDTLGNTHITNVELTIDAAIDPKLGFGWDESIIYHMLTDRFYDGDPTNNNAYGRDEYQPGYAEAYHGGDLAGIVEKIDYLDELGVNTIWISPIVENTHQMQHKDTNQASYHLYWGYEFLRLDPHLGDMTALDTLLDAAAAKGIKVMVDIVLNHAGYAPYSPSVTPDMIRTEIVSGDLTNPLGDGWIALPDFRTEDPVVRQKLVEWQTFWIDYETAAGNSISSFRVDTAKHVDNETWQALKNSATKVNPNFKMIGEDWTSNTVSRPFLYSGGMDALLDFDFSSNSSGRARLVNFVNNGAVVDTNNYFNTRATQITNSNTLGMFMSSHDQATMHANFSSDADQGHSKSMVLASLQMTVKGIPVIYYGEEVWSQKANYTFGADSNRMKFDWDYESNPLKVKMLDHYKKVIGIRNDYSQLFAKGEHITKLAVNRSGSGANLAGGYLVFERKYNNESLFVALNTNDVVMEVKFATGLAAGTWLKDLYSGGSYTVDASGDVTIALPSRSNGGTIVLAVTEPNENLIADTALLDWDVIKNANTLQTEVIGNLSLVTTIGSSVVTWSSANAAVVAIDGAVVRPDWYDGDSTVTLTATITNDGQSMIKSFVVVVVKSNDGYVIEGPVIFHDMGEHQFTLDYHISGVKDSTIANESVTWGIKNAPMGMSMAADGKLTTVDATCAGPVVVTAIYNGKTYEATFAYTTTAVDYTYTVFVSDSAPSASGMRLYNLDTEGYVADVTANNNAGQSWRKLEFSSRESKLSLELRDQSGATLDFGAAGGKFVLSAGYQTVYLFNKTENTNVPFSMYADASENNGSVKITTISPTEGAMHFPGALLGWNANAATLIDQAEGPELSAIQNAISSDKVPSTATMLAHSRTFTGFGSNTNHQVKIIHAGAWAAGANAPLVITIVNYTTTVTSSGNGTVSADPSVALCGSNITVTAVPAEGYRFKEWVVVSGGVNISDLETDTATFTMPANNVSIRAEFELITYSVEFNSNGGSAVDSITGVVPGSGIAKPADPTNGTDAFGGWFKDEELQDAWDFDSDTVTDDITLYAKWIPTYAVTVTSGTGGGRFIAGTTVTVVASSPATGKYFAEWTISPSVIFVGESTVASATIQFVMPAEDVTVTATYGDLPPTDETDAEFLQARADEILRNGLSAGNLRLDGKVLTLVIDGREFVLSTNANNRNISGEIALGDGYYLKFDIKGNGSNIKEFKVIQK